MEESTIIFRKPEGGEQVSVPANEAPVVENNNETQPVNNEPINPPTETQPQSVDYYGKIKEVTGHEFKSDEEIKSFFEEYKNTKAEYEKRKGKDDWYDEMDKLVEDQVKNFNEEDYKKSVIANELSKRGHRQIAEKFVSTNINEIDDLEVCSLYTQFIAPKLAGKDKISKELVLSELGIDTESLDLNNLELDDIQVGKLALKAANIREQVNGLINGVQIPKHPFKERYEQYEQKVTKTNELKSKWDQAKTRVMDSVDSIDIKNHEFSYKINKEVLGDVIDKFLLTASKDGIEPDEAGMQRVVNGLKNYVKEVENDKIIEALLSHKEAKLKEQWERERINGAPIKTNETPPTVDKKAEFMASVEKSTGIFKR